jgi:hypothetical protein
VADVPHAPRLRYLCDDNECCDNGSPDVRCRACGHHWPCPDWRSRHTPGQVLAQVRWVARKRYPGDEEMVDYAVRQEARRA